MEGFEQKAGRRAESFASGEDRFEFDKGEWWWTNKNGRWEAELVPLTEHTEEGFAEKERRQQELLQMLSESRERAENFGTRNEGFLQEHPRYNELFEKWGMRYLRQKGFNAGKYSGEISQYGTLYDNEGIDTGDRLIDLVRDGLEWIDEYVETELLNSEGFTDITNDFERREELDLYPDESVKYYHET